ncbi:hypothetical protein CRUP_028479 [Coryphaenoides rupestris]|nr:hypothetical protein CRUP_028479 [Coryphaenoides rupestris]
MESSARRTRFQLYTSDESHVIENAVSAAIRAVLDAIHTVTRGKLAEYQSVVEERDREISRLEYRLRQHESELRALRGHGDHHHQHHHHQHHRHGHRSHHGAPAAGGGGDGDGDGVRSDDSPPSVSAERPPSLPDPRVNHDHDTTAAYSSRDPSNNREHSSSSSSPWGHTGGIPYPAPLVKEEEEEEEEEPSGCEAFFIKLEMCEQSCGSSSHQDDQHLPDLPNESSNQRRRLTDAERNKRYRQRCRSTPEGLRACREKERLRYLKRRVLVAEMSEEARRRKREMWRAAARRHRDRKTGATLPHGPPAGGDLFDDWAALRERAESPARELDRRTWSALRGHCQEHGERDV